MKLYTTVAVGWCHVYSRPGGQQGRVSRGQVPIDHDDDDDVEEEEET